MRSGEHFRRKTMKVKKDDGVKWGPDQKWIKNIVGQALRDTDKVVSNSKPQASAQRSVLRSQTSASGQGPSEVIKEHGART